MGTAQLVLRPGDYTYKTIAVILMFLFRFDLALAKSNDIYNIKVLKQTEESVLFEISYYYSGDHGDNATPYCMAQACWPLGFIHNTACDGRSYDTVEC
jgi:hypothetical protein